MFELLSVKPGIDISSDTSSEPPISRKGQAFAIDSIASSGNVAIGVDCAGVLIYLEVR